MTSNIAPEKRIHALMYEGFAIEVSDKTWRFMIVVTDEFAEDFSTFGYDSLDDAKKKIDVVLARIKKQKRVSKITKVPVLLDDGTEAVWKGLHSRTGSNLIEGHPNYSGSIWPLDERVKALLQEKARLHQRSRAISATLEQHKIERVSGRTTEENYESQIAEMHRAFEGASARLGRADLTVGAKKR